MRRRETSRVCQVSEEKIRFGQIRDVLMYGRNRGLSLSCRLWSSDHTTPTFASLHDRCVCKLLKDIVDVLVSFALYQLLLRVFINHLEFLFPSELRLCKRRCGPFLCLWPTLRLLSFLVVILVTALTIDILFCHSDV